MADQAAQLPVSIIIPVYNAEKWIHPAYEQAAKQTWKNLEIIFIDNNSTDNSTRLIQELQETDSRVRLLYEKTQGAGAARNTGIRAANSDFISFVDADDTIESWKVERHMEILLDNREIKLVYGKIIKSYMDEQQSYTIPFDGGLPGRKKPMDLAYHFLEHFGRLPGINAVTCEKKAVLKTGGFEENITRGEDAAFMFKMAVHYPCYFDDETVGHYYRHGDSTVSIDNQNRAGNPYYIQYRDFFLPYVGNLPEGLKQKAMENLASEITALALIDHTNKLDLPFFKRRKTIAEELTKLRKAGLHTSHQLLLRFSRWVPAAFMRAWVKLWSVVFGVRFSSSRPKV